MSGKELFVDGDVPDGDEPAACLVLGDRVHEDGRIAVAEPLQGGADIDRHGLPVHGDRQLLAWDMAGADLRASADVPEAHRVGSRTEVERAAIEDPVVT